MSPEALLAGAWLFAAVVVSLVLHECAHALCADRLGDPTARLAGRLTPNPLAHLDPFGTAMLALLAFSGFGLGWARPVPVDPRAFRRPRRDMALVALAGPCANLLLALLCAALGAGAGALGLRGERPRQALFAAVSVNAALFAFNMIPVFPLDGSRLLVCLLPPRAAVRAESALVRLGARPLGALLLLEWFTPVKPLGALVRPAVLLAARLAEGLSG